MSQRPVIGITMTIEADRRVLECDDTYIAAVYAGGGIPLLLPSDCRYGFYDDYLDVIDGFMISGGQDILPNQYGEESRDGFPLEWKMTPDRDAFEVAITQKAMARDIPVFGICRGMQLLAVANGGSLYQDIETQVTRSTPVRHYQKSPEWNETHRVSIEADSLLAHIFRSDYLMTNSLHHQAVRQLPKDFRCTATAGDGITEAIESVSHEFVLGVQWHPERLLERHADWRKLFLAFCEAASRYRLSHAQ